MRSSWRRSWEVFSGITQTSRYPLSLAAIAKEIPVLPDVGSRIVQPGRSVPSFSATSTIFSAARSLMEPVGFWSSSLAHSRTSGEGESRGRPTSGVLPTESRAESKRTRTGSARGLAESGLDVPDRAASSRDGWEYDDLVTVAHRRLEPTGESDVLVVDVDVDESPQVAVAALGLHEPFFDTRVVRLE